MAGIYIHIPYCRTFCIYCDFYSELSCKGGSESFVSSLMHEFEARIPQAASAGAVETVYFGGGTPSVLGVRTLVSIMDRLRSCYDLSSLSEVTLEVNPDDVVRWSSDDLATLRDSGFNRISMGVQSFDDGILKWMRRRHDSAAAVEAWKMLRGVGFQNVSIDLIFGFPLLSDGLWAETLHKAVSLPGGPPEHISSYQLTVEPGSALAVLYDRGEYVEMDDEGCARQYSMLQDSLQKAGYEQYEISNFCLPGFHSRHNSSYWKHVPYLGFGPGAHSLTIDSDGHYVRLWNRQDLAAYVAGDMLESSETLSHEEIEEEKIMLGLRCRSGIELPEHKAAPLLAEGLLERVGRLYRVPREKLFISEYVIGRLVREI